MSSTRHRIPNISVAKRSLNRNSGCWLRVCWKLTEKSTNRTLIKYRDFLVSFNRNPELVKQPSDAIWKPSLSHLSVLPAFSPMATRWLQPGICSVTEQESREEVHSSKTLKGHVSLSKKPMWLLLLFASLPELHHVTSPSPFAGREPGRKALCSAAQSYHHPQTTSLRMHPAETRVPIRGRLQSTSLSVMFALVVGHLLRD